MSCSVDSADRALRGRIGAYRLHATHDTMVVSKPGRDAFLAKFYDQVDPDRTLPEAERERRATMARKAHMAALAYRSARSRSKRAAKSQDAVG